jgi:hypothetical protein
MRFLLYVCPLIVLVFFVYGCNMWFNDAATVPNAAAKRAILLAECKHWSPSVRHWGATGIIVVQRDSYAAVTTFIDFKNLALYRNTSGQWQRITPNGWLYDYDKMSFWRAGAPLLISNALVNGLRREYHRDFALNLPLARCAS